MSDARETDWARELATTNAEIARTRDVLAAAEQRRAMILDSPAGKALRIAELREQVVALEGAGKFDEAAPLKSEWLRLSR